MSSFKSSKPKPAWAQTSKPAAESRDLHYIEEKDPRQAVARERAERAATEAYEAERNERMDALDRQIRQRPDNTRVSRRR